MGCSSIAGMGTPPAPRWCCVATLSRHRHVNSGGLKNGISFKSRRILAYSSALDWSGNRSNTACIVHCSIGAQPFSEATQPDKHPACVADPNTAEHLALPVQLQHDQSATSTVGLTELIPSESARQCYSPTACDALNASLLNDR